MACTAHLAESTVSTRPEMQNSFKKALFTPSMHGQLQIEFANVLSLAAAGSEASGLDKGVN